MKARREGEGGAGEGAPYGLELQLSLIPTRYGYACRLFTPDGSSLSSPSFSSQTGRQAGKVGAPEPHHLHPQQPGRQP